MTITNQLAVLLASITLATACSGSPEGEPTAQGSPAPAASATAETSSPPPKVAEDGDRCLPVSAESLARLAEGAKEDVGELTFTAGAAVQSKEFGKIYMVAARFKGAGADGEIGVWATNNIDPIGRGRITSVDGPAKQFTAFPDGEKTAANITAGSEGVDVAKDCLK